jgi:hypothetical protein
MDREGAEKVSSVLADEAPRLMALERYERSALARRKNAIREFVAATYGHPSSE